MSKEINANRISVDPLEIVFLYKNSTPAIKRLIFESLHPKHREVTLLLINKELSKLKDEYNRLIIEEARRIIKDFKRVEFSSNKCECSKLIAQ